METKDIIELIESKLSELNREDINFFRNELPRAIKRIVTSWGNWRRKSEDCCEFPITKGNSHVSGLTYDKLFAEEMAREILINRINVPHKWNQKPEDVRDMLKNMPNRPSEYMYIEPWEKIQTILHKPLDIKEFYNEENGFFYDKRLDVRDKVRQIVKEMNVE